MFELIKVIAALTSAMLIYREARRQPNGFAVFVMIALWIRFTLSAFHTVTYPPMVACLSINALGSILVVAAGLVILPSRLFILKYWRFFYAFAICIGVSALLNQQISGLILVYVKWAYYLVLASATFLAVRHSGLEPVFKSFLYAFALPVGLQVLSILLGESKAAENDGSTSYIGGYNHEAAFSMIIVGFTLCICVQRIRSFSFQNTLFCLGIVLLFLTNYRTAMLAVLPIVIVFCLTLFESSVHKRYHLLTYAVAASSLGLIATFVGGSYAERFNDLAIVASHWQSLIKAPVYFTEWEQDIFSARVYLWSQYVTAFVNADGLSQLFGFGPESWNGVFEKYAHNTFVSYLYEFGYVGLGLFSLLNIFLLYAAWQITDPILRKKVFFSVVGFLVLNLATMPLWNIEGLIVYALLTGVIFAFQPVKQTLVQRAYVNPNIQPLNGVKL